MHGAATGVKVSCPGRMVLLISVMVDGQQRSALLDSGCSVTLIKATKVAAKNIVTNDRDVQLETMSGQQLHTRGWVQLDSLCSANIELGPVKAYIVSSLPLGADIVIGLPLLLRVGCWIGEVNGQATVQWGTVKGALDKVTARSTDTATSRLADTATARLADMATARLADMATARLVDTATARLADTPTARLLDTTIAAKPVDTVMSASMVDTATAIVDDTDFIAEFRHGCWNIKWKWKDQGPLKSLHRVNYSVAANDLEAFDAEISSWIRDGILIEYNKNKHGDIQRFLPLMAVRQEKNNQYKVRPVFDYRSLNSTVESHPGGATPLCAARLREWRQLGANCAILDLRKAYLQVHVDQSLWVHQAVSWRGGVYLLTRLGFGLASAPKVMTALVEWILAADANINAAVTSYIDDLFVKEDLVAAEQVKEHLRMWGLESKAPERLGAKMDVRVLGVRVDKHLQWSRDKRLPEVVNRSFSRRQVHSILGEWLGHFPVAGWLRVMCGFLQRRTAIDGVGWDAPVSQDTLRCLHDAAEMLSTQGDPVKGRWLVSPDAPINVWVDASSLAVGVALEIEGDIVEDATWLRPKDDSAHINRAELDAALRGINMALQWGRRKLTLITDSATVYGWLQSVINKTRNIKTRALSEVLIRRRLDTIQEIIKEMEMDISVKLVSSVDNLADQLTRVPKNWCNILQKSTNAVDTTKESPVDTRIAAGPVDLAMVTAAKPTLHDVKQIHDRCHFGVDRTLELARERFGACVSRRMAKKVVSRCDQCTRIDPSVVSKWDRGSVSTTIVWQRWATDITHVMDRPYLSIVDSASGFTMWRELRSESAREICSHLQQLFSEFGPPASLMSDNGTVFRSRELVALLQKWDVLQELTCAYRPQGNGTVERVHRSVKRTVARSNSTVQEAVFWVNNTRGTRVASPYELVFSAISRKPGVTSERVNIERPQLLSHDEISSYQDCSKNPFVVGDRVYLRRPDGRCDLSWSGPHRVTMIKSSVSVELNDDGISRHISHLRRVPHPIRKTEYAVKDCSSESESEEDVTDPVGQQDALVLPRRGTRVRRIPDRYTDPDF